MNHHRVFGMFHPYKAYDVEPEYDYNFIGVKTKKAFVAGLCRILDRTFLKIDKGSVLPFPDIDEEYPEWIDILESVVAAQKHFTMIELGAGYGRWLANAAAAVRQFHQDMPLHLIAVEAEPTHAQWLKEHMRNNCVDEEEYVLIEAAAAGKNGVVSFTTGKPDEWYGQHIMEDTGKESADMEVRKIRAISLKTILSDLDSVDIMDMDVQGSEYEVLASAVDEINEKVKKIHIGTHSRAVERSLREMFRGIGWFKVHDFMCFETIKTQWGEIKFGDGVQTWRNLRLSQLAPCLDELNKLQELMHIMEIRSHKMEDEIKQMRLVIKNSKAVVYRSVLRDIRDIARKLINKFRRNA